MLHVGLQYDAPALHSRAWQRQSFRELRDWLLSRPDWVGAGRARSDASAAADVPETRGCEMVVQPKSACILDNNNHSK